MVFSCSTPPPPPIVHISYTPAVRPEGRSYDTKIWLDGLDGLVRIRVICWFLVGWSNISNLLEVGYVGRSNLVGRVGVAKKWRGFSNNSEITEVCSYIYTFRYQHFYNIATINKSSLSSKMVNNQPSPMSQSIAGSDESNVQELITCSESPGQEVQNQGTANASNSKENNKDDGWAAGISFDDVEVVDDKLVAMKGETIKKVTVKKLVRFCIQKGITGYKNKSKDQLCDLIVNKKKSRNIVSVIYGNGDGSSDLSKEGEKSCASHWNHLLYSRQITPLTVWQICHGNNFHTIPLFHVKDVEVVVVPIFVNDKIMKPCASF